jgi:hypothetical protein
LFHLTCCVREELKPSEGYSAFLRSKPIQKLTDTILIQHRCGCDRLRAPRRQTQLAPPFVRRRRFTDQVTEAAEACDGSGKRGSCHTEMRRECARTYRILRIKMRENGRIMGREVPERGSGAHVIDVTGEIDLRKEPLDFKNSCRAHMAIVEAEKSFVNSNGRRRY